MADSKLTALSATTAASTADLLYIVTDVATTPASKKITVENIKSGLVPTTRTVNDKALSGNITLGLASADFANQGSVTTVLHGNAAGNPAFGGVVELDLSFSDNATNNASTTAHGLLKKLSGVSTQYMNGEGNWATPVAGGASLTKDTFTNGDLSTGVLTVTHSLGLASGAEVVSVVVLDNSKNQIIPDEITCGANSFDVDLTSYGTLSGTWQVAYIS